MTEEAQGGNISNPKFSQEAFDAAMARLAAKEAAQNQVTTPVEPITQSIVQEIQPTGTENAVQQEMWFQEWRKENRMKKFFQIAAWVIAIGGFIGIIVGYQIYTKNKAKLEFIEQEKIKSIEQAKTETIRTKTETTRKAIIELADKHNAVVDWNKPSNELSLPIFTMEVEDILLHKDNRPVLLLVTVNDIERKGNKYSVCFVNYSEDKFTEVKFILDCSDEQVRKIMQQQSDSRLLENYAVVAVINKVKKITFGVNTEVTQENDGEEYSPSGEIVIDMLILYKFVATGHCVDLLFVGDYGYDLHPEDKKE